MIKCDLRTALMTTCALLPNATSGETDAARLKSHIAQNMRALARSATSNSGIARRAGGMSRTTGTMCRHRRTGELSRWPQYAYLGQSRAEARSDETFLH